MNRTSIKNAVIVFALAIAVVVIHTRTANELEADANITRAHASRASHASGNFTPGQPKRRTL